MTNIYRRYFDKHKPLRHYTQHLFIAVVIFIIAKVYLFKNPSILTILIYFLFTYLIDLDHIFTVFLTKRYPEYRRDIVHLLKSGQFEEAAIYATKNHKRVDRLIIHNFFFYIVFLIFFIFAILNQNSLIGYMSLAVLVHMSFDIFDDYFQLGHLRHWSRVI